MPHIDPFGLQETLIELDFKKYTNKYIAHT